MGGAAPPTAATLLSDVATTAANAVPVFNVGDVLTLTGTKGGANLPPQTFTVTATSSVGELSNFYEQGLGIDTNVPANPAVPAPGVTLDPDAANPNSAFLDITGNEGGANKLEVTGAQFINQLGLSPLTLTDGTNAAGVPSDPAGESVETSITAYDSLGNPVDVNLTAVLETTANTGNTWRFFATSPDNAGGAGTVLGNGTLTFDAQGNLKASTGTAINISRQGTGARSPMAVNLDFSQMTELASAGSTMVLGSQDGLPPGTLASFSIGTDGTITGSYSNGVKQTIGQVAMASFANPDGLNNLGGNVYTEGANSGVAAISAPGQLGTGQIRSGALELSNVDLSTEFTNLIIASTGFSASSRVISTSDQLIQDLLNSQH